MAVKENNLIEVTLTMSKSGVEKLDVNQVEVSLAHLLSRVNLDQGPNLQLSKISVKSIVLDSRKVSEGSVFLALKGAQVNGEEFINQAIQLGAIAVLLDDSRYEQVKSGVIQSHKLIPVKNLAIKTSEIAADFFGHPSKKMKLVGVTGTNGKSTLVTLIAQIETILGKRAASMGTVGYGVYGERLVPTGMTTPDAIECQAILHRLLRDKVTSTSMEVSSHGIAQYRVAGLVFDTVIITNITREHLDYHGTYEEYANTKKHFISDTKARKRVINVESKELVEFAESLRASGESIVTCSAQVDKIDTNLEFDFWVSKVEYDLTGVTASVVSPWGERVIRSPLIGDFNLSNLLSAIAATCESEQDFERVCENVGSLVAVLGRLQPVNVEGENLVVIVDYAHTPDALERVLKFLKSAKSNNLWLVFGCGGDRDVGKRPIMGTIAEKYADRLIVTSDNPRSEAPAKIIENVISGTEKPERVIKQEDRALAIQYAIDHADQGDCILIAGKGHEAIQVIGDQRIVFNDVDVASEKLKSRKSRQLGEGLK